VKSELVPIVAETSALVNASESIVAVTVEPPTAVNDAGAEDEEAVAASFVALLSAVADEVTEIFPVIVVAAEAETAVIRPTPKATTAVSAIRLLIVFVDIYFLSLVR
jgi:hypothetical protein